MNEPLSLIGLCFRFRRRMEYCLPYWLDQDVDVHICMTTDPDGARGVLLDLANYYPDKLHLHTFGYKPLQRGLMYHDVVRDIKTQYCAFFDLDCVPPPDFISQTIRQITPQLAMSAPRVHILESQAEGILREPRKPYEELHSLLHNQRLQHDSGREMVGYFQLALTKHLAAAARRDDHDGVNAHDTWIATRLNLECHLKTQAVDCRDMLHLGHTKCHKHNPGINF